MFSFFKLNDPFRLIGIGIYILLLTIVYLTLNPFPITNPQLTWMLLGERLGQGYYLYQDIIDDNGPLSAGFFTFMDLLFGRSQFAYEVVGRILISFQILYWNSMLIKFKAFDVNTYLPAIIMAALFHFSFDLLSLSPALLGSCFLILALGQLFSQTVLQKDTSESTLLIGIYAGLATGFHPNYILFLPYMIFTGIAISSFSFRQLMLSLVGYFLPLLLISVFYFWNDGLEEAIQIWPLTFLSEKYEYQSLLNWLILGLFPLLLAVAGYFMATVLRGSTINQQKQRQLIIIWLLFSAAEFFIIKKQAAYQLVILVPGLTYLITQFFLNTKKEIVAKIAFYLLVLGVPAAGFLFWQKTIPNSEYFVGKSEVKYSGDILVLGDDLSPYLNARLGGPFLNYRLSKLYLDQDRDLREKGRLFQMLQKQKPSMVLDPNGDFEKLIKQFPALEDQYSKTSSGVFTLKK
ncbi:hypothetical protein SYJ56_00405 [Algoriphagus sp. D3-2-R+10]|uniref:hypothetical protein n=1 Tax=Algoriphagus aurantiacus TaxID=3103948 RepID=UPI002B384FD5|nr:hypothetical protein [Algoriphagus sp. D3-2-R+10]MEB2773744.1 hypothetical protein [Algoriphagus sp. D3-2-R+10]